MDELRPRAVAEVAGKPKAPRKVSVVFGPQSGLGAGLSVCEGVDMLWPKVLSENLLLLGAGIGLAWAWAWWLLWLDWGLANALFGGWQLN